MVARCNGVAEVAGSNPVAPTRKTSKNGHLAYQGGGRFSFSLSSCWVANRLHATRQQQPAIKNSRARHGGRPPALARSPGGLAPLPLIPTCVCPATSAPAKATGCDSRTPMTWKRPSVGMGTLGSSHALPNLLPRRLPSDSAPLKSADETAYSIAQSPPCAGRPISCETARHAPRHCAALSLAFSDLDYERP